MVRAGESNGGKMGITGTEQQFFFKSSICPGKRQSLNQTGPKLV